MPQKIIVHSFKPVAGGLPKASGEGMIALPHDQLVTGGFSWATMGDAGGEAQVRAGYAAETDTTHHDYLPTHIHRLVKLVLPDSLDAAGITARIVDEFLDRIESGSYDNGPRLIAKHDPTKETPQ